MPIGPTLPRRVARLASPASFPSRISRASRSDGGNWGSRRSRTAWPRPATSSTRVLQSVSPDPTNSGGRVLSPPSALMKEHVS
jgi:hypothetical protein